MGTHLYYGNLALNSQIDSLAVHWDDSLLIRRRATLGDRFANETSLFHVRDNARVLQYLDLPRVAGEKILRHCRRIGLGFDCSRLLRSVLVFVLFLVFGKRFNDQTVDALLQRLILGRRLGGDAGFVGRRWSWRSSECGWGRLDERRDGKIPVAKIVDFLNAEKNKYKLAKNEKCFTFHSTYELRLSKPLFGSLRFGGLLLELFAPLTLETGSLSLKSPGTTGDCVRREDALLKLLLSWSRVRAWACWIYASDSLGLCNNVTRFDWMWKLSENIFRNVFKSPEVLNIWAYCCGANCAIASLNNCSTSIGPFSSMQAAKKSSNCWVALVSIWGCGRCNRSDNGTSCMFSTPSSTTHSSITLNVSGCLARKSVNSLMCWPEMWRICGDAWLRCPSRHLMGTSVPMPYCSSLCLK